MENVIRLPLEQAYNIRELGGYYTKDKRITKWHRFLRGDDISHLSNNDIDFLQKYGVSAVIDLRSHFECNSHPDALKDIEGIEYYHIPFMSGDIDDVTKIMATIEHFDLGDFYVELLKDKKLVAELLTTVANAKDGCILFHCSAGKDRTGVLSMLLFMIAGVGQSDIEANYQLTYTYLKEKPGFLDMLPKDIDLSCMYSKPETIRKAIEYIVQNYGNIEAYLDKCQLSKNIRKKIIDKLLI